MSLSLEHADALRRIEHWYRSFCRIGGQQVFRLIGPAGSGKTRLVKQVGEAISGTTAYLALTGKAAHVLRTRGCGDASTLHCAMYIPFREIDASGRETTKFILSRIGQAARADLIIVDEASMVDHVLSRDLLSFGKPILAVGDPHQLPPLEGVGFLQSGKPDFVLTEIHRQAFDSPIIQLATRVREGKGLQYGNYGLCKVLRPRELDLHALVAADQILVGTAARRRATVHRLRALRGQSDDAPIAGDRVVCLRNERKRKLFNGTLFKIENVKTSKIDHVDRLDLLSDDELPGSRPRRIGVDVNRAFFEGREGALSPEEKRCSHFTFADALTVHKAQGSQWEHVFIFDESAIFKEDASKWLYSALTRAATKVTLITEHGIEG